jgi:hypothetical protein
MDNSITADALDVPMHHYDRLADLKYDKYFVFSVKSPNFYDLN